MVNKEVYENLTEEKLCFCDTRPDKSIKKVIEYLWWDEKKDYFDHNIIETKDANRTTHNIFQI